VGLYHVRMPEVLANVGIPVVVIILAALWNRSDIKSTRDELSLKIDQGFMRIENRLLTIEGDIRGFHSKTGNHEGRIESLEKQSQRK
jgi:hypothetical protein